MFLRCLGSGIRGDLVMVGCKGIRVDESAILSGVEGGGVLMAEKSKSAIRGILCLSCL